MKRRNKAILIVLLVLTAVSLIVFGFPDIIRLRDETFDALLSDTVPRLTGGIFLICLLFFGSERRYLLPERKGIGRAFLWSIPCFLVAVVNFPFSALITGSATVMRVDLLWIFLLKCFSVALLEEAFFRGLLLPVFEKSFQKHRYAQLFAVLVSATLFALFHLINLAFGGGVGDTLLQVGYTFLTGAMFAVMLLKTGNLWLCVLAHFLFDVGGLLVFELGDGDPQDTVFWILTAVIGVLCLIHIVLTLVALMRKEDRNNKTPAE